MSRFDYPDPGMDPEYCNPLSPEPDQDDVPDEDAEPDYLDDPWNREYEREAARARMNDFAETGGKDWT